MKKARCSRFAFFPGEANLTCTVEEEDHKGKCHFELPEGYQIISSKRVGDPSKQEGVVVPLAKPTGVNKLGKGARPRVHELYREIADSANDARQTAEWWLGASFPDSVEKFAELLASIDKVGAGLDNAITKLRWLKREAESWRDRTAELKAELDARKKKVS